ncbi:MAG: arsenate reductase ArsC [Chloroflexaceae bacterium]
MITPVTADYDDAHAFVRILADDVVWRLVKTLAASDVHLRDLQIRLRVQPEVLEERLEQLEQLGLVSSRTSDADARLRYYRLQVERLHAVMQQVLSALHPSLHLAPLSEMAASGPTRPRVLFLCTENSARSQLAEALLRQISRGTVEAYSAGTKPGTLNPLVAEILGEAAQGLRSKHVDEFQGQHFDYVVTVCDRAREACPSFAGADRQVHWSIPDPAAVPDEEARLRAFSVTACELTQRIRYLLTFIEAHQRTARSTAMS